jgi:hypothetical protein
VASAQPGRAARPVVISERHHACLVFCKNYVSPHSARPMAGAVYRASRTTHPQVGSWGCATSHLAHTDTPTARSRPLCLRRAAAALRGHAECAREWCWDAGSTEKRKTGRAQNTYHLPCGRHTSPGSAYTAPAVHVGHRCGWGRRMLRRRLCAVCKTTERRNAGWERWEILEVSGAETTCRPTNHASPADRA